MKFLKANAWTRKFESNEINLTDQETTMPEKLTKSLQKKKEEKRNILESYHMNKKCNFGEMQGYVFLISCITGIYRHLKRWYFLWAVNFKIILFRNKFKYNFVFKKTFSKTSFSFPILQWSISRFSSINAKKTIMGWSVYLRVKSFRYDSRERH